MFIAFLKERDLALFWDEIGHVVTNFHVIKQASEATIRLNDGRSYNAVLVGVSPAHDLAVLRINVPFDAPAPVSYRH